MSRKAIFPGSFDPFTNGHLDTVKRAAALFDEVTIACMTNSNKHPLFGADEKQALIKAAVADLPNVNVVALPHQLTVAFAQSLGATYMVRGLRSSRDFDYEADVATINTQLAPQVETVFLLADPKYRNLSSSMVKEVASFGADVSQMVPANIAAALRQKLGGDAHA
ncbi:pantetheine-phosphate adenylyltransferase [Lacticaseibacillus sp. N501-2]|uniref:pantetheine-phosphate adenylyltransferase n=1 Tax=Lacticaseibacillus salsurae TaxID=3367729 RepID=UPI0038B36ACE